MRSQSSQANPRNAPLKKFENDTNKALSASTYTPSEDRTSSMSRRDHRLSGEKGGDRPTETWLEHPRHDLAEDLRTRPGNKDVVSSMDSPIGLADRSRPW